MLTGCGGGSAIPATGAAASSSAAASGPVPPIPSTASAVPTAGPGGLTDADWPTYHRTVDRAGFAPATPPLGRLAKAWTARLDGAVYAQPLVVGDRVLVATENDSLYALGRSTGQVLWRAHVGTPVPLDALPCGNIDPLGITGTPVYDPRTGLLFAVAETTGYHHLLVGVDVVSGDVRVRRELPTPGGDPRATQQRPALALAGGRVYVAFGGLFGDCGRYVGSVVGAPAGGDGALVSYRVPTAREGAIWATGGPTVAADGTLYVSVGNGAATSASDGYDGSDSVLALSPDLRRIGLFAPRTWAADNARDLDLGSMSPALLPDGHVLIAGKRGTAYLLDAGALGGVGGELAARELCRAFGGPARDGGTVYLPCIDGGLAAVRVGGSSFEVLWRGPEGTNGSPVVGGGAVWVVDWDAGTLYALDPATGATRARIDVADELAHFTSPTLSRDIVLVGTTTGVVAVRGA